MSRTGSLALLVALVVGSLAGGPAHAEEPPPTPAPTPSEEDEGLPDAAPLVAPKAAALAPMPVPRLYAGVQLGASFPLAALGPGITPAIEVGGLLGKEGRFQPFLAVAYTEAHASGTGDDAAFPEGYAWTLAVRSLAIAPGLRVRLLPWRERVSPELTAGPLIQLDSLVVGGAAGASEGAGAAFPETSETRASAGGFLSAGLVGRLGPGQLEGHVTFSVVPHDGDLTGSIVIPTLTPSIGYRVSR